MRYGYMFLHFVGEFSCAKYTVYEREKKIVLKRIATERCLCKQSVPFFLSISKVLNVRVRFAINVCVCVCRLCDNRIVFRKHTTHIHSFILHKNISYYYMIVELLLSKLRRNKRTIS